MLEFSKNKQNMINVVYCRVAKNTNCSKKRKEKIVTTPNKILAHVTMTTELIVLQPHSS